MKRAGKTGVRAARAIVTAPFLERLTEHVEHVPLKFEHLVEEQDAVVRQAHFSGPRLAPPPTSAAFETVWWGARKGVR